MHAALWTLWQQNKASEGSGSVEVCLDLVNNAQQRNVPGAVGCLNGTLFKNHLS